MTKAERWLTTIALILSVLPLILLAYTLRLLPSNIAITSIGETTEVSKYDNLFMGLFCIVPLSIVIISGYLKRKLFGYKNYAAIMCASMVMAVAFTCIVGYGISVYSDNMLKNSFDIGSLVAILFSLLVAVLGAFFRYQGFGSKIAYNNKFTRSSERVWRIVHGNASAVQTVFFVSLSTVLGFFSGYISFLVFVLALVAFVVWARFHSFSVRSTFSKKYSTVKVSQSKDV